MRALLCTLALLSLLPAAASAAKPRVLFDDAHGEIAGNADWQIDTDSPLPIPDQSTITPATPRTIWSGAISSWGVDLVKRGYYVIHNTQPLTYLDGSNPYDLSTIDVLVLPEPNTRFSAAESTAIFRYVRDGGGLVFVVDHWNSDRNGDGWDSPEILNALDPGQRWGVHAQVSGEADNNITQNSGNVETAPSDSVIHGPYGVADSISFHNGATFVLSTATNPRVRGLIWMNGLAHGATGAMAARSEYGNGRIVFAGDSSPIDDGSAVPGNSSIYDGWAEATGRDSLFFLNATAWVARKPILDTTPPVLQFIEPNGGQQWMATTTHTMVWSATDNVGIDSVTVEYSLHGAAGPWWPILQGVPYTEFHDWTVPDSVSDSVLVRVTAWDHALNHATDACDGLFAIVPFPTGVGDGAAARLSLAAPAPNPSAGRVTLSATLPAAGSVSLELLDVSGRVVRRLARGPLEPGVHAFVWDGRDERGARVEAGLYFARLVAPWGARSVRLVRTR